MDPTPPTSTINVESAPPSGANADPDTARESALISSGEATPAPGNRGSRMTLIDDSARYKVVS
jgi:hypothetical protein